MTLSQERLSVLCKVVEEISKEVGQFLLKEQLHFSEKSVENKGVNDLVSYVDKTAEYMFVERLKLILPQAGFIAEEGTGDEIPNGLNWVIDPLDGTTNYIHRIPFYCTSVALIDNDTPLIGVIYDPSHDELFSSHGNAPSTLNSNKIRNSNEGELKKMLVVTGFPYNDKGLLTNNLKAIESFCRESRGIRRLGSAALDMAYVACGRFDSFYEYGLNPWDVAAGTLLVKNAGGLVDDFNLNGNPIFGKEIIAASQSSFVVIQKIVAEAFNL